MKVWETNINLTNFTNISAKQFIYVSNTTKPQYKTNQEKQVDSSLSKNQALISQITVITIIIKNTMISKKVT